MSLPEGLGLLAVHLDKEARLIRADFADHVAAPEMAYEDFVRWPLHLEGTPFQQAVWHALMHIEPGQRRTYRWVAEQIGRPRAVRAVANAIAANPVALRVPCHRVIRSDGRLGGYAWGVEKKAALLHWETFV
ncbi:methylated-DNA--[protein]-cysteine S-methyltransferase [Alcanivorax sp.]|uniref:methylated-DNA--[protein]-cysteine S-methyltransferase n=1 Tax=Alcanivorax sp. TaxID=1872427 RepID=UPI002582F706|nr:methylated-DNA--[protein]-cysteine S-methyltransferase [Alcanivorax sp.]